MTNKCALAFLNSTITIFRLLYSLYVPHGNQNPKFFPAEGSVSILSKFIFRRHLTAKNYFNFIFRVILPLLRQT